MAVLQKIRDKNILLVTIVAIALLLFVIQGVFSGNFLFGSNSQTAGEVNGEELTIQDYQQLVSDFQNYVEVSQPEMDAKSEEAQNRIRDYAWQNYVTNHLIEAECEKAGLAVTDEEIQNILHTGESQLLQSPLFMNQETGQYDPTVIPMFLQQYDEYKKGGQQMPEQMEKIYKFIRFVEEQLKYDALQNKYRTLLAGSLISNPVEAKMSFEKRTLSKQIELAYLPFSSVDDSTIKVTDEEISERFKADKEKYASLFEVRDAKLINVVVTPSDADKTAIEADFEKYYAELDSASDLKAINMAIRNSGSDIQYTDILKTEKGFPTYISSLLTGSDSTTLSVGQTSRPKYDELTKKYYVAKLISKEVQVDSVLYREIAVTGNTDEERATRADSIYRELNSGANYAEIAKRYNQPSDSVWVTTSQYENERLNNDDVLNHIKTLFSAGVGVHKFTLQNGNILIIQILDTKSPVTKYNVAIIDKPFLFSEQTYNEYFNKFSKFVASYKTIGEMEAAAGKNGYNVQDITVQSNAHLISGVRGTQDALRWLFDEADMGEISQIYRCGNNDDFMVISLSGVNDGTISEKEVKEIIKSELINEKKADQLLKKLGNVKTMDSAKSVEGIIVLDSITTTGMMPAMVGGAQEPMVSMKAAQTAVGKFCGPFKGSQGVYMLQVLSEKRSEEKFNPEQESMQIQSMNAGRTWQSLITTLVKKDKVKDYRYKFNM